MSLDMIETNPKKIQITKHQNLDHMVVMKTLPEFLSKSKDICLENNLASTLN